MTGVANRRLRISNGNSYRHDSFDINEFDVTEFDTDLGYQLTARRANTSFEIMQSNPTSFSIVMRLVA